MKKIILSCLVSLITVSVYAQATYLSENFDLACATSSGHAANWFVYNPVAGTSMAGGAWACTPTNGRETSSGSPTPGMMCTSVYGTPLAYNLDTSYLVTPLLNISSYAPDSIYLYFDSKVTNLHLGGKLNVIESNDTAFNIITDSDITATATPIIGQGDSSDWVTHEINITRFEHIGVFYIGFRYVGTPTSGSTWYLDNVNTSTIRLFVPNMAPQQLPLTVVGSSASSQITISYSSPNAAAYQLALYDMLGRELHKETLNARGGFEKYTIDGLSLHPGMYVVKMGNGSNYGTAKAIVQ